MEGVMFLKRRRLIRKLFAGTLGLAIAAAPLGAASASAGNLYGFDPSLIGMVTAVDEHFDGTAAGEVPASFSVSAGGGTVRVAEVPDASNKSLFLEDTSTSTNVIASVSFGDLAGEVTIRMKFMMPSYVSSSKVVRVKGAGGTPVILETKSGSVTYRHADDTYEPIASVVPGEWIDFKIEANTDTDTADVYVNGERKVDDAPFYSAARTINFLESFTPNGSTGSHYIDDVVVTGFPEGYVPPVIAVNSSFNSEEVGRAPEGYDVSESGGTVRIAAVPDDHNKSVFLDDTSTSTNVVLSKSFEPLAGKVTMRMKFMQPAYTSSTKIVRLKGSGKTPIILETEGGNISYKHADGTFEPLSEATAGEWYDIVFTADFDTQTADVWVDGEQKLAGAPFQQAADRADYFETFTPNSKTIGHYIDDVVIYGDKFAESEEPGGGENPQPPVKDGIYEAEDAVLSGAIIDNKHSGYTGTGFIDFNPNAPGGYVEWTVPVESAGEYTLAFRYSHGKDDVRPAEIRVNGEIVAPALEFGPTGDYTAYKYVEVKAQLQAGENQIRLTGTGAEGGSNIDHLRIYSVLDLILEAEEAVFSGAIIDNKHPGYTGTGFVDYNPNAPGGWIEWTVTLPAAGEYTLEFRYASGATEDRPAEIRVNGETAIPQLSFPSTGDFAKWETVSGKVTLAAGDNVIRATATGPNGGANIDHLRIHNAGDSGGPAPVELEEVELEELLGGVLMRKLYEIGMLATPDVQDDAKVLRIEFISMLNDALGTVYEEHFQLDGVSNEWDAYVLQAAVDAGIIEDALTARPYDAITRREAADLIAAALDLRVGGGNGSIGVVMREGYMSNGGGRNFGINTLLTAEEAAEIMERIAEERENAQDVRIVGVHTVTSNIVAVTLNAQLTEIDYKDIAISVPTGSWKTLNPSFRDVGLTKGAAGTNRYGNTVLFFETAESFGPGASYHPEPSGGTFFGDLAKAVEQANNLVSWQMDHGGWTKSMPYDRPWDGVEPKSSQFGPTGIELGAIDNNATVNEIRFISQVFRETGDAAFQESVAKGIGFLLEMQHETGGWPQVYPERGTPGDSVYYSNYVTFNDNAMINVLDLFDDILNGVYPFDEAVVDEETMERIRQAKAKGIVYILKSQIVVDGVLTAWCAQHDPFTYEPRGARAYEHPSISGSESVAIVRYLMSQPDQMEEMKRAIRSALAWFDAVKLDGIRYVSADPNGVYFVEDPSSLTWYRFYEIGTNRGIFSGRDGIIKYSIQEIEQERRDGYSWGGSYAKALLETAKTTGYFVGHLYGRVVATNSMDASGRTLREGDIRQAGDVREALSAIPGRIVVAQDGTGDVTSVQAAVDAVPENNTDLVEIYIRNGIYKEVVTIPANKPFITMVGESAEGTVITYDNYSGKERLVVGGTYGTSGSATMFVNGTDFTARDLTIENSFDESSVDVANKQAVALNVRGERHKFINVRFIGNQDTLLTNGGTQYFYQCYIEGDVDFIFGGSSAVFEECVIHSLDRGFSSNNGYITAASTMITEPYGYLILNSKLTSDAAPGTVWLGRPWHPSGNPDAIASVVYMNTEMGAHINPVGWTDMSGFLAKDARFAEYNNYGPGAVVTDTRPQLTAEEAALWTIENVLKGWNPKQE